MKKIQLQFLKTFFVLFFSMATTVGFSQQINSIVINPTNPTECMNFDIRVDGTLWSLSYAFLSMTYSVSGSVLTVDLKFNDPGISVPAIGSFTHTVTASNVPAGTYSVVVNSYLGAAINSSMSTSVTTTPCCQANANISTSATAFCLGDSTDLTALNITATSLQWEVNGVNLSTNTITNLNFANTGTYNIVLTATLNGCSTTDMTTITVDSIAAFDLGVDTSFCTGNSITLDATAANASGYLWSTGETTGTITVDSSGTYSVNVTDNACAETDVINITVNEPAIDLGADILLCYGETAILADANSGLTYLWSTGATTSSITVDTTTMVTLTATDADGCQATDDNSITLNPEITIGLSDTATIDPTGMTLDAGVWTSYLWSTGDTTQTISVDASGIYSVTVGDGSGCEASDTINITVVSAQHLSNIQTVKVFPNPATVYLQIDATNIDLTNSSIIIANGIGQVLKMIEANNISNINIADLANGVYYLKILDKNNQAIGVAKFVKL